MRVGFFALRNISSGEELTFDYQFQRFGESAQLCYCGSDNCRGYLGVNKDPPKEMANALGENKSKKMKQKLDPDSIVRSHTHAYTHAHIQTHPYLYSFLSIYCTVTHMHSHTHTHTHTHIYNLCSLLI